MNYNKKVIAIIVIIAFMLQSGGFVFPQAEDEIIKQFRKALDGYENGQYKTSKERLNRLVDIIKEKELERKRILGQCYLLLGAIFEKEGNTGEAETYYQKALMEYGIDAIEGIDLSKLPVYYKLMKKITLDKEFQSAVDAHNKMQYEIALEHLKRLEKSLDVRNEEEKEFLGKVYLLLGATYERSFGEKITRERKKVLKNYYQKARAILQPHSKQETSSAPGMIEKEKYNPIQGVSLTSLKYCRKYFYGEKKFPWVFVVGGIVVITVLAIILLKKKNYTLTVSLDDGVIGSPVSGSFEYGKGEIVKYSYDKLDGFDNLEVRLDGERVSAGGTITMDQNHTLTAVTSENIVDFEITIDEIEIEEGESETFGVRLSEQPKGNVTVTISPVAGDESLIQIEEGGQLTFSTADYNVFQYVSFKALDDNNTTDDEATIEISDSNISKKAIKVKIQDKGILDERPIVHITYPLNGQTVKGVETITVDAVAKGNKRIKKVDFYINGEHRTLDETFPYTYDWYTLNYFDFEKVAIKVIAYDSAGQYDDDEITVTVYNGGLN